MHCVEVLDCLLGSYRPDIRGKKWYWPLFLNALYVAIVAAWQTHCHVEVSRISHLDFCQEITLCLLKSSKVCKANGVGDISDLPNDIRFDGIGHMRQSITQGRYKYVRKLHFMCLKCGACMHSDKNAVCFEIYYRR